MLLTTQTHFSLESFDNIAQAPNFLVGLFGNNYN